MSDLYPTPTRIKLLHAVDAGEVTREWSFRLDPTDLWDHEKVNGRMAQLARAGWVTVPPLRLGGGTGVWALTDAGREILRGVR